MKAAYSILVVLMLCGLTGYAQQVAHDPRVYYKPPFGIMIEPSDWKIISYQLSILPKRGSDLKGPYLIHQKLSDSKEAMEAIGHAKPGDKLFFEEIHAQGPDKRVRSMNPVAAMLQ